MLLDQNISILLKHKPNKSSKSRKIETNKIHIFTSMLKKQLNNVLKLFFRYKAAPKLQSIQSMQFSFYYLFNTLTWRTLEQTVFVKHHWMFCLCVYYSSRPTAQSSAILEVWFRRVTFTRRLMQEILLMTKCWFYRVYCTRHTFLYQPNELGWKTLQLLVHIALH